MENITITDLIMIFVAAELLVIAVAIITAGRNFQRRKEDKLQSFLDNGEKILEDAVKGVMDYMTQFAQETVVETVQESYKKLVARDLIPAVKGMTDNVDKFTQNVSRQQEEGLERITERMTEMFTNKMHESLQQDFNILSELSKATGTFNENTASIISSSKMIAATYEGVGNRTAQASADISNSVIKLESSMTKLNAAIDASASCVERLNNGAMSGEKAMEGMVSIAAGIEKTAVDFASTISSQNAETVILLNDAVRSLGTSAEMSAKEVFSNLNEVLAQTNEKFENTIKSLNVVSQDIHKAATEFAFAISNTYVNFSETMDQKVSTLSDNVTRSAESEYNKMFAAIAENTASFDANIEKLKDTLESYLQNMHEVAGELSSSSDSFRESAGESSNLFVRNIDETIEGIFKEFDSSLAVIAECLVKSTERIKDAADSLPIAVNALKSGQ